ncbi:unnamed protein product [Rodentolepis nana]|uniref:Peregrin n=1 Tax=Rodentolepis nana TaxID=102285 RepID=A0A0R3SZZ7_RODNA|nr:unnamed protein product [Rodentolepis nana]
MSYIPVDFDIPEFLTRICGNKPPFTCPAEPCKRKPFKNFKAIQNHMNCHRPPDPVDISNTLGITFEETSKPEITEPSNSRYRPMRFLDSQKNVVFNLSGDNPQSVRCGINVPIRLTSEPLPSENQFPLSVNNSLNGSHLSSTHRGRRKSKHKISKFPDQPPIEDGHTLATEEPQPQIINVPLPKFEIDPSFAYQRKPPTWVKGAYLRFIERSVEELDEIVEYDLDEEDLIWLEKINEIRKNQGFETIQQSQLEWVLDRFEKKAVFRTTGENGANVSTTMLLNNSEEDDAVCAVCQDGNCENLNVILFCDVCNLAVHQDCYGVPYIPEGSWLCRKCLISPSEPVSCCLCPNAGGAFKKTSDDRWAHVICGLWIPEVMFANLTFLEPLDDIDKISPQRWALRCFICKQKNVGACIQCHKQNCYKAFHVTCAQQAGLYMKIEQSDDPDDLGVRKLAYCDMHCPPSHFKANANKGMYAKSDDDAAGNEPDEESIKRTTINKARRVLAERRNSKPQVCVPIVTKSKMAEILSEFTWPVKGKEEFFKRVYAFWKLKREARRGVPLLKRLQAASRLRGAASLSEAAAAALAASSEEQEKMRSQLIFTQRLRHDLERARLLCELVRKRERVKRELVLNSRTQLNVRIQPTFEFIGELIKRLQAKDTRRFFGEPVTADIAPDYLEIIKNPMDFSTMKKKHAEHEYFTVAQVKEHFDLIVSNCCEYNAKDTVYYKAAVALADQCAPIFKKAFEKEQLYILTDEPSSSYSMEPIWEEDQTPGNEPDTVPNTTGSKLTPRARLRPREPADSSSFSGSTANQLTTNEQSPPTKKRYVVKKHDCILRFRNRCVRGSPPSHSVTSQQPPRLRRSGAPRGLSLLSTDSSPTSQQLGVTEAAVFTKPESTEPTPILRLPHSPDRARPAFTMYRTRTSAKEEEDEEEDSEESLDETEDSEDAQASLATGDAATSNSGTNTMAMTGSGENVNNSNAEVSSGRILRSRSQDKIEVKPLIPPSQDKLPKTPTPKSPIRKAKPEETLNQTPTHKKSQKSLSLAKSKSSKKVKKVVRLQMIAQDGTEAVSPTVVGEISSRLSLKNFEHLDLVWAKCRGSPWYPAMVIDPTASSDQYTQNGVPIPIPPESLLSGQTGEVASPLNQRGGGPDVVPASPSSNGTSNSPIATTPPPVGGPTFLVVFFDGKRTWQRLPREKLFPLATNTSLDEEKLQEARRSKLRQSVSFEMLTVYCKIVDVVKAYQRAIEHYCKVNGRPYPFSENSGDDVAAFRR